MVNVNFPDKNKHYTVMITVKAISHIGKELKLMTFLE